MKTTLSRLAASILLVGGLQAATIGYTVSLSGANEVPPNASPGTGTALVTYDDLAHTLRLQVGFGGLMGNVTVAHIHCCTAIAATGTAGAATTVPTLLGFPVGVTAGFYDNTLDLTQATSWNPTFITNNGGTTASAEAAFVAGLSQYKAYLNIHSSSFPSGEISGFLVPEPSSALLLLVPLAALAIRRRRA